MDCVRLFQAFRVFFRLKRCLTKVPGVLSCMGDEVFALFFGVEEAEDGAFWASLVISGFSLGCASVLAFSSMVSRCSGFSISEGAEGCASVGCLSGFAEFSGAGVDGCGSAVVFVVSLGCALVFAFSSMVSG